MVEPAPIPYTLRLGVTGHRKLADTPAVTEAVKRVLLQLRTALETAAATADQPLTLGHTRWQRLENLVLWKGKRLLAQAGIVPVRAALAADKVLRWRVVSGLADGADRVVARQAMEHLGAKLEAVLPFAPDEFRKDFDTGKSCQEFDDLLAQADQIVCPGRLPADDPAAGPMPERPAGYRRAGEHIVNTCEVLIAVWDGQPPRGEGGTAGVIGYALSLNRLVIWIDARDPGKPACLPQELDKDFQLVNARPLPELAAGWSPNFVQLLEYNRDPAFNRAEFERQFKENRDCLVKAGAEAGLLPERFLPVLKRVLPHYSRADQLALHYQRWHIRSATWLYRLAAMAVAVAVLQSLFWPQMTGLILLEILALLVAVAWYRLSLCEIWHEKWLHYRHLAERFRTVMFTALLKTVDGIHGPPADQPLPFYPGPGGWVVMAFDEIAQSLPASPLGPADIPAVRQFLLTGWITDQAKYHADNARQKHQAAHAERRAIGWMLALTFVAACLHWLKVTESLLLNHFIASMAIILPAFAAAHHAIGGIHDYERIAARSARMAEILRGLERSFGEAISEKALRRDVGRAENIMSTENHEWCVSLSFRHLTLPV
jgi:hypothetical protein